MSSPSFIDRIEAKLASHPDAKVEKDENRIWVLPADDAGFTVLIFQTAEEYVVYYNGWHDTFPDEDSAVSCFLAGLTDARRLVEERRGGQAYKWTLETKAEEGWWTISTTGMVLVPIWKRKKLVTLQNRLLRPREAELAVSPNADAAGL